MEELAILVKRAQNGDYEAYADIVRRFQDMAVGYSYAILGDMHLAEDAAQEAFIKAYYDLPALRQAAAFPGWFRRIVFKNIDRIRRDRASTFVELDLMAEIASSSPSVSEVIESRQSWDAVEDAIETLPESLRSVITLFYINDYSLQEIGAFLEIPVATVKTRLHNARKKLKKRMVAIMQENLPQQRPSRDDQFTQKVINFFRATAAGDTQQVKTLLQQEAALAQAYGRVESPLWDSEMPALQLAVMHGHKDIVDVLLANGADINQRDEKHRFSALHQALDLSFMPEYAALDMPEFLLSRGAKQDIFSLMWMGKYDEAKAFIQTHPEVVNTVGTGMAVPLCYANTVDMAQFLLDHGADIHVRLENNNAGMNSIIEWCAYHWLRYHNDVLKLLIDHAKIEIDPFLLLILGEFDQVRGAIKANSEWIHERTGKDHVLGPGLTLLHLAVQLGPVDVVADLLNMGAAMNATAARHKNMTPLHLAIWRGPKATIEPMPSIAQVLQGQRVIRLLPDIPRLLLERGADIHAKDSEVQRTPLQWAEMPHEDETDRTEVAALLREFGAKA